MQIVQYRQSNVSAFRPQDLWYKLALCVYEGMSHVSVNRNGSDSGSLPTNLHTHTASLYVPQLVSQTYFISNKDLCFMLP